jgi:ferrous iron transport protein B
MANINIFDCSILSYFTNFLDPLGKFIGLDGVIIMAFILGFPANEIVVPIIIMSYMTTGNITELSNLSTLKDLLLTIN